MSREASTTSSPAHAAPSTLTTGMRPLCGSNWRRATLADEIQYVSQHEPPERIAPRTSPAAHDIHAPSSDCDDVHIDVGRHVRTRRRHAVHDIRSKFDALQLKALQTNTIRSRGEGPSRIGELCAEYLEDMQQVMADSDGRGDHLIKISRERYDMLVTRLAFLDECMRMLFQQGKYNYSPVDPGAEEEGELGIACESRVQSEAGGLLDSAAARGLKGESVSQAPPAAAPQSTGLQSSVKTQSPQPGQSTQNNNGQTPQAPQNTKQAAAQTPAPQTPTPHHSSSMTFTLTDYLMQTIAWLEYVLYFTEIRELRVFRHAARGSLDDIDMLSADSKPASVSVSSSSSSSSGAPPPPPSSSAYNITTQPSAVASARTDWAATLRDHMSSSGDTSVQRNLLTSRDLLRRAQLEFIARQVAENDAFTDQELHEELRTMTLLRTSYFWQADLLLRADLRPCPVSKFPPDWKPRFMRMLHTFEKDTGVTEFAVGMRRLAYAQEMTGNAFYAYLMKHPHAEERTDSTTVIQETKSLAESEAIYQALCVSRADMLNPEKHSPYRDLLILNIFNEKFYQSFKVEGAESETRTFTAGANADEDDERVFRLTFLRMYTITHRNFVKRAGRLSDVFYTRAPPQERRPILVCLLGKFVLYHRTDVVYYAEGVDSMVDLLLTWVYLVCTQYHAKLEVRNTPVAELLRRLDLSTDFMRREIYGEEEDDVAWGFRPAERSSAPRTPVSTVSTAAAGSAINASVRSESESKVGEEDAGGARLEGMWME